MMIMNVKALTTAVVSVVLVFGLTACGDSTPTPTETKTPDTTVTTPATPTPTETAPEAIAGTAVELNEDGVATLPNGEVADCSDDPDAVEVIILEDGSWECARTIAGLP